MAKKGEGIACPFSSERLREMHWKELLTIGAIAEQASHLIGHRISIHPVYRWFREVGVKTRTRQEATGYPHRREHAAKRWSSAGRQVASQLAREGKREVNYDHLHCPEVNAKIGFAKRRRETRVCSWCAVEVTRIPSRFNPAGARIVACSRICSGKDAWFRQKWDGDMPADFKAKHVHERGDWRGPVNHLGSPLPPHGYGLQDDEDDDAG